MHTISSLSPRMANCAPGTSICYHSLRCIIMYLLSNHSLLKTFLCESEFRWFIFKTALNSSLLGLPFLCLDQSFVSLQNGHSKSYSKQPCIFFLVNWQPLLLRASFSFQYCVIAIERHVLLLQESLELSNKQTKPVAATCLSFPSNDVNKFIVGSEECTVYQGQRHGSKPGISLQFEGHWGPVTSISSHRATGPVSTITCRSVRSLCCTVHTASQEYLSYCVCTVHVFVRIAIHIYMYVW